MQSDNACACFVRVGRCRFGSILGSILESFWGPSSLLYSFWSPGWPKQAHNREAKKTKKETNWRLDRAPRRGTFGPSSAPNFEKAIFYVLFGDFCSVSKKAVKIELPKGGRMCNPTMPVHVS